MDEVDSLTEADWDLNSIKWYDKLFMFATEYPIKQIELCDEDSLLTLGEKQADRTVITLHSLPQKIKKLDPSKEGLVRDYDLKIKAGTFTDFFTTQVAYDGQENLILASQKNMEGIVVYQKDNSDSDKILEKTKLKCGSMKNPDLCVYKDFIIASGLTSEGVMLLSKGVAAIQLKWDENISDQLSSLTSRLLNDNTIVSCNRYTGECCLYDTRIPKKIDSIAIGEQGRGWTMDTNYKEGSGGEKFCLLSRTGHFVQCDSRKLDSFLVKGNFGSHDSKNVHPSISCHPDKDSLISVCGLDSMVHIVDTSRSFRIEFSHCGHEHTDSCVSDTIATSAVWYTPGGSNAIISGADNSSLNCWVYNPQ